MSKRNLPRWPRPLYIRGQTNLPPDAKAWHEEGRDIVTTGRGVWWPDDVRALRDWCNRWLAAWEARQEKK